MKIWPTKPLNKTFSRSNNALETTLYTLFKFKTILKGEKEKRFKNCSKKAIVQKKKLTEFSQSITTKTNSKWY